MIGDSVKASMEVSFVPFSVPSFARLIVDEERPSDDQPGLRVADLPRDALDALAARWLDNLYANQARPSPWRLPPKTA